MLRFLVWYNVGLRLDLGPFKEIVNTVFTINRNNYRLNISLSFDLLQVIRS